MTHLHSLDEAALRNAWATVGIFDGVHLGHRALLSRLVEGARAAGSPSVVLTLHPHPAVVLGGQTDFAYLTPPDERAALLTALGVETVITLPFSRAFAAETAEDFMRRLVKHLGLRHFVLGYDTALGRGREGNAARLTEIGQTLGYSVEVVGAVQQEGRVLSSSAIRQQVRAGAVEEAAKALGRWYALSGPVVHGDGRGRHINIPTANIQTAPEKLLPARGIYAAWAHVGGERFPAATNIGVNPTFTPSRQTASVEAHLLDFQGNLYGQEVRLEFVARLRDEMKFPSVEALLEQIWEDIARVRALLT
ncbi:MAG: bifunctional riboflavin kinase/FAD synthetase [Anaerolineales bacterium]